MGGNKEKLNLHWDFERQIVNAMEDYKQQFENLKP